MATESLSRSATITTLIVVCLVFFLDIANIGMANIALPTIQRDLGYDDGTLQWVLTAYSLTYGGFLMAGGRLGDIFGHGNMLIFGMTLFNVASLICALVNDQIGLIVGRALQGLGAAFTIPSAQSLVALAFDDPQERVTAFAVWGGSGSSGFVFGPIIGGLLTSLVSWEWIFWLSLIAEGALEIAAFALLFTHNLPGGAASSEVGKKKWSNLHIRLDALGTALSVPGLILLVYGLTAGNGHGWDQADVIATLVIGVALLAAFGYVEARVSSDPILPRFVWGNRIRMLGCVLASLTYGVWLGANYLLTLQLQSFGFSPLSTALRFLPLGITAVVINIIAPTLLKHTSTRILLLTCWPIELVGLILFTLMSSGNDYWRLCLPGMILYIGGGNIVYFVGNVKVVASATPENQGTVSGVYNMFLNVGGAVLGVALLTVINDSVASSHGGKDVPSAVLAGFRAGYYGAVAMTIIGAVCSIFFRQPTANDEQPEKTGPEGSGDNSIREKSLENREPAVVSKDTSST